MSEAVLVNFTHKLYAKLAAKKHSNFFISPFSISTVLAMCYFGAKDETARQLKELLCLSTLNDEQILQLNQMFISNINDQLGTDVVISTANKIYQQEKAVKDFVDKVKKNFRSSVKQLNFSNSDKAAQIINQWVAKKTQNKISKLISPSDLNALTGMVLVNAIYFKGNWQSKFYANATVKKDFHDIDGKTTEVDMMHLNWKMFCYISNPGGLPANTCIFPYVGQKVFMAVILPEEGKSLDDTEAKLTPETIGSMISTYIRPQLVNVQLPKFKLEYKEELSKPFIEMGAPIPFDMKQADFSGIDPELFISAIVHQAVVEVNEEGTEAAAVTAAFGKRAMRSEGYREVPKPIDFICNRPFMFVIYEKIHGSVLFIGKYVKPTN